MGENKFHSIGSAIVAGEITRHKITRRVILGGAFDQQFVPTALRKSWRVSSSASSGARLLPSTLSLRGYGLAAKGRGDIGGRPADVCVLKTAHF